MPPALRIIIWSQKYNVSTWQKEIAGQVEKG